MYSKVCHIFYNLISCPKIDIIIIFGFKRYQLIVRLTTVFLYHLKQTLLDQIYSFKNMILNEDNFAVILLNIKGIYARMKEKKSSWLTITIFRSKDYSVHRGKNIREQSRRTRMELSYFIDNVHVKEQLLSSA